MIKCRPSGLSALVRELNHNQRLAVESIGFGGLLHMKDLFYIPWSHMHWFLKNFDPTSRVLDVEGNKKIVVTADDISDLFLLPRHQGRDVLLTKDNEEVKLFIEAFKERYGLKGAVTLSVVQKLLKELRDGCGDFKRCFVLYCLSSFLAPNLNQMIDLGLMRSLIDTEKIASFDWCKYVLEKLCKAMLAFQNKPRRKTLNGCVLVLPLLYFHRLRWQGRAEPSTLPLIQHWTSKRIKERVYAECLAGRFGQGEWVDDVYPVSLRDGKTETQEENEVFGDKVFEEIVEMKSKGCITFQLPPNEKDDMEIHNMGKDVSNICLFIVNEIFFHYLISSPVLQALDESFLLLKRDMNVIYEAHKERLRKSLQQQETQTPSSSSHVVVPHI